MIGRIFVASEAFSCSLDGEQTIVNRGDTIREGHPLLERYPMYFALQKVKFEHKAPPKAPATRKPK